MSWTATFRRNAFPVQYVEITSRTVETTRLWNEFRSHYGPQETIEIQEIKESQRPVVRRCRREFQGGGAALVETDREVFQTSSSHAIRRQTTRSAHGKRKGCNYSQLAGPATEAAFW